MLTERKDWLSGTKSINKTIQVFWTCSQFSKQNYKTLRRKHYILRLFLLSARQSITKTLLLGHVTLQLLPLKVIFYFYTYWTIFFCNVFFVIILHLICKIICAFSPFKLLFLHENWQVFLLYSKIGWAQTCVSRLGHDGWHGNRLDNSCALLRGCWRDTTDVKNSGLVSCASCLWSGNDCGGLSICRGDQLENSACWERTLCLNERHSKRESKRVNKYTEINYLETGGVCHRG